MASVQRCRRGGIHIMTAVLLVCVWPVLFFSGAFAAVGDPVQTIANPAHTTIDVFDYWVYNNNGSSQTNYANTGINRGHEFAFSGNGDGKIWNKYTGEGNGCYQGIVQPVLVDGYPVLAVGQSGESLAYLFNDQDIDDNVLHKPAKRSYMGANYLFTVDENGYYLFDSSIHNALLNKDTRIFSVTEQKDGRFSPFGESGNDKYFFGVHVNTEFSIPSDGKVLNPSGEYQNMVFEFSGDDDVWMFFDGVLVGDVGGIHNKHALTIDFVTGDVRIWNAKKPEYASGTYKETTIYDMFVQALGEEAALRDFEWKEEPDGTYKTLAGGTYHTMDFFYLERGAGGSNMEVRYNMVSTYDFTGHKTLARADDTVTSVLQANQFRYRLTGQPLPVDDVAGLEYLEAPMPRNRPDMNVDWYPDYSLDPLDVEHQREHGLGSREKTLVVANSADGNINYGSGDMESAAIIDLYKHRTFRYKYEELPPEGAEEHRDSDDTVYYIWNGQEVRPNADGTYTFGAVTYDLSTYYFTGTVNEDGSISKTFYTDETYTTQKSTGFINFKNRSERTTLIVEKQVQGTHGSTSTKFNYILTVPEKAGKTLYYSINGGEVQSQEIGTKGEFTFQLKHGEKIEFYGIRETYTLKERYYGDYWVTYQPEDGDAVTGDTFSRDFDLTGDTEKVTCTNLLSRAPTTVKGKKTLKGRDLTADEFFFTMTQVDTDGEPLEGGSVRTVSAAANGEFKFGPISYAYKDYMTARYHDAEGNALYYYIVSENIPEGAVDNIKDGIKYTSDRYLVIVTVHYDESTKALTSSWTPYAYDGHGVPGHLMPAETADGG